ncbi:MAG: biotin-dependent carboxyltransferase family protein [Desulfobacterales bacterium]
MAAIECIEILSPGLQTTVQDLGRFGFGRYGVAPSGALDPFALRIGNLLVDNPENQACLETTLLGLRIKALTDVLIAVTGANLQPQVDKHPLEMWCSHILKKGQILSFIGPSSGCRSYIAVGGGIDIPPVMGSKSTSLPSGFGGFEGKALEAGAILFSDSPQAKLVAPQRKCEPKWIPTYPNKWIVRMIWGPQDDDFTEEGRQTFLKSSYEVSSESDRTGIRLLGPLIQRKADIPESIISEGQISGNIQVPGDGKPIIILGETVSGGYRKIATVISADLPLLGQIRPGDEINFKSISLDEANQALRKMESRIQRFKRSCS